VAARVRTSSRRLRTLAPSTDVESDVRTIRTIAATAALE